MKLKSQLQFVLACGVTCGILGCKSPSTWFSKPAPLATTAPEVHYNGMAGYSTVKQNPGTEIVSGAQPEGAMTKAWNSTTGAVSSLFATGSKAKDATSLNSKPGKLDGDLYLRAAHIAEQGGNFQEAQAKYQQALKVEPKNVDAVLGLARLYDQQGNSQQALATYQQAVKLHPKNAKVYNDFGLCYGHRRELAPAQQMLQKAVELEPGKTSYRMNLAVVLVDLGRPADAYQQLAATQPEGVARYNMACLLEERGQQQQAADQLRLALAKDPGLAPARELLAQLEGAPQNMQTVSANLPSRRDDSRAPQGSSPIQAEQQEFQPPVINYGPVAPANEQRPVYQYHEDTAPAPPQYPGRRTSHEEIADDENAEPTTPATVRISDDE